MGSDIAKTHYAVMLSSTYKELVEHREAVRKAMLGQRLMPVAMEDDAVLPDKDLISASLSKVEESDAYVGLISYRYGQAPHDPDRNPNGLSLTELEFRRAVERKIPICMFIMHDDHPVPRRAVGEERGAEQKYDAFVKLAKTGRIYAEFTSVDDLKAKAVQSLVELRKILERSTTPGKINSDRSNRGAIHNIPINIPRHFLGREADLAAIESELKGNNGRVAITALHGLRGVGKTTLAAAYAERHRADYRVTWWIRAETESAIRADLVGLGVQLGWAVADEKEERALAAVMERLSSDGEGILLVYDNANNSAEIRPYMPRIGAAQIIVTSNAPNWGGIAAPVEIEVWPKEIGADYLIAWTRRNAERETALVLSETLGGLPLAHEQAAAYCDRLGVSIAEYTKRFAVTPGKFLDDARAAPAQYHNGLTVAKTFALAIDEAAKLHPAAESLIVYAALLPSEPIPLYLFSETREMFDEPFASALVGDGLDEAVAELRAFALIDRESIIDERDASIATDCIRLHRLVRQVAAARCEGEALKDARRMLLGALAKVFPKTVLDDPTAWPRARRLDALALAFLDGDIAVPGGELPASYLLVLLAAYRQGPLAAFASVQPLLERALAIEEKLFGADHPKTAGTLNKLGYTLMAQGNLAGARVYFERSLALREREYGPDHPNTASNLHNLGSLLRELGDFAAARPYCERALAVNERSLGPDHPTTGGCLSNLGALLHAQGDFTGAQPYYERAMAICEKTLGPDHPDTATSLSNFGTLLQAQGKLAAARPYYERALAITERVLGFDHPDTAATLNNFGSLLCEQGDLTGALRYYDRSLVIVAQALGHAHPSTKIVAKGTAAVLDELNRTEEAATIRNKYGLTD
ncbi:MAG: hypothetical protein QOI05_4943 [Bradyrhizobium sp.]|jgi:tetratricopeptide (TPR) repeat protein|nr:hypothetical protein [Bradyrhizobium sp.]